jgi:hypothetical protein
MGSHLITIITICAYGILTLYGIDKIICNQLLIIEMLTK